MKLIRLKLNVPFRSLAAGFEIYFLREWDYEHCFEFDPYCLAGRNGSGKSNILEALASIFYHIECIYLDYRPDGFEFNAETNPHGFRAEVCTPDAFELEYFFPNDNLVPRNRTVPASRPLAHIRISKATDGRPEIHWLNRANYEDMDETALSRAEVKDYLPKYVLGYSSGHNEILSLPFFKMRFIHFDEYRDHLTKDVPYDGKPEGRMIYLDDQFSQAILLCHFLFPSDAILRVFEERIGLKGIRCFRIIIRRHHRFLLAAERLNSMTPEDQKDKSKSTVELTSKLCGHYDDQNKLQLGLIDKLIKCSTTHHEEPYLYEDNEAFDLYLDYWVNEATREAFQVHFGTSVNLFQSLQTLLTLNYYRVGDETKAELYKSPSLFVNETIPLPASDERIMRFKDFEIIKNGATEKIYTKALSDGEHQLAHTIGLCLLFRQEPALFLLDEPETHLNPDWRASYITTLRAALEADAGPNEVMREVLLTSHSPFIISDCQPQNVLVFKKDGETRKVTCDIPDFNTFGASVNAITLKVFGQQETIGDYAMSKLKGFNDRLRQDENPDQLIDEAGKELGDSVEKVLFINRALNKKEGR